MCSSASCAYFPHQKNAANFSKLNLTPDSWDEVYETGWMTSLYSAPVQKVRRFLSGARKESEVLLLNGRGSPHRNLTADQYCERKHSNTAVSHHTVHTSFNLWMSPSWSLLACITKKYENCFGVTQGKWLHFFKNPVYLEWPISMQVTCARPSEVSSQWNLASR